MPNPAVTAFAEADKVFKDRQDAAITGIEGDVNAQADLIRQLQARPDGWTAEDQALLDQIQSRNAASTAKLEALDNLTPPVVPVVP